MRRGRICENLGKQSGGGSIYSMEFYQNQSRKKIFRMDCGVFMTLPLYRLAANANFLTFLLTACFCNFYDFLG